MNPPNSWPIPTRELNNGWTITHLGLSDPRCRIFQPHDLLNVRQVAELRGVYQPAIKASCRQGRIKGIKVERKYGQPHFEWLIYAADAVEATIYTPREMTEETRKRLSESAKQRRAKSPGRTF